MVNHDGPPWDESFAKGLAGSVIIVGITTEDAQGNPVSQVQMHGRITTADQNAGIVIALEGTRSGETYTLPPVLEAIQPAKPGEYRLRSTGEVIIDPDYTTTWTRTLPAKT